jgi:hypothetical protein
MNTFLGQRVGKSRVVRAKYRIPGIQVTVIDLMGVETTDTLGTPAHSVHSAERCSQRFDSAHHVCDGVMCMNGVGGCFEDRNGSIGQTLKNCNSPFVVILTQASTQHIKTLVEAI